MAITHSKVTTISDWTQAQLNAQIALGNYPAGTLLADIVLPSDHNADHVVSNDVVSTTSTATLTVDYDTYEIAEITAQAEALSIANPTGTPANFDPLLIRYKDDGTARAITHDTQFRAQSALALPTTTVLGKWGYEAYIWNSTDSKWDIVSAWTQA